MKTQSVGSNMTKKVLTENLLEPLNGTTTAKVDINSEDGNLTIDGLIDGGQVLASGTLQYFEKQGLPTRTLNSSNGLTTFTLKGAGSGKPWFRFPWAACNEAHEWLIHLNPMVSFDIIAHSGGGNVKLNLTDMVVTRVSTDTGGGNIDVILPGKAADLNIAAKTGAGNVTIQIAYDTEARIYAASGLGKVIMNSRFTKIDDKTYQSPGYDGAVNKVEITANTGAGNVIVSAKM